MGKSYLPTRESLLRDWCSNFSTLVTATPTAYGLVSGDATALAGLLTTFLNAYDAAHEPSTRTHSGIVAKNTAKAALLNDVRILVRKIQATPSVTAEQKADLGITIPDRVPTPVPPPSTKPVLSAVYCRGNIQTLRVRDEAAPDTRGKPWGSAGVEVYAFIGANPTPAIGAGWTALALESRTTFEVTFNPADAGKQATLVARWFNDRCEFGPFSDTLSVQIAGPVSKAA